MGVSSEAQLIVPKVNPLEFERNPVICLAGKTGAGKSVVARYLSVFYGFNWIRTRDVIRELSIEDSARPTDRGCSIGSWTWARLQKQISATSAPSFLIDTSRNLFVFASRRPSAQRTHRSLSMRSATLEMLVRSMAGLP